MKFFARVPNIDFMAQRKTGLLVSAILTVAAILLVAFKGLNLAIDFTGGVIVEVSYPQQVELESVRQSLATGGYDKAIVQAVGGTNDVMIRLPVSADPDSAKLGDAVRNTLATQEPGVQVRRIEFVGPQVGEELTNDGALALLMAFVGIALYIMFRFQWKFSVGAIAALVHDAVMVLGFLSLFSVEFDITTVAAILALIGYSNNETIVIFDRVRENMIEARKTDVLEIVNLSVNQTLLRSVITHLTTLLVCIALFALGGHSVHSFSVAMIVGVIVATYSSIYVSTNLAVLLGASREDLIPPQRKEVDDLP